jgi:predicted Rossmann-fold nucleotide-binding protein
LGDGRNIINILSSDVVVALPGSTGTLSEIALALKNQKPLYLLGWNTLPKIPGHEEALIQLASIPDLVSKIKRTVEQIS